MRRIGCAGLSAAGLLCLGTGSMEAQQSMQVVALDRVERTAAQPFSLLRGLRELSDGRVLVTDYTEDRIAIVDFANGTVTDRNRTGQGPEEFRLPGSLFPFPGDSTLLVDAGNTRIAVLDPDGRIARTFRPSVLSAVSPGGTDRNGRLFFTVPPWEAEVNLPGDTLELGVWDPATDRARTLARIHGFTPPPRQLERPDGPRVPYVMFAQQDSWAVAPDGRLAVVRGGDYSVQWFENDRVVATGPANAYRTAKVRDADREAIVRQFLEGSPTSGRGPGGTLGHAPVPDAREIAATTRRSTFAETMPFFRPGDLRIDAGGRLWVGRTMAHDEARRYDVFDRNGRRIGAFRLAPGRRLIGFGARHLYLVSTNQDNGLETLERLTMPALAGG